MRTRFDMAFGAVAAMALDYAAVAFIFGLLILDRWLGFRRGITLDTMFVLIDRPGRGSVVRGVAAKPADYTACRRPHTSALIGLKIAARIWFNQ